MEKLKNISALIGFQILVIFCALGAHADAAKLPLMKADEPVCDVSNPDNCTPEELAAEKKRIADEAAKKAAAAEEVKKQESQKKGVKDATAESGEDAKLVGPCKGIDPNDYPSDENGVKLKGQALKQWCKDNNGKKKGKKKGLKEESKKEEPPKEEPKKEEPPKEELKKEEPPKEELKKEEPPKEDPKKVDPKAEETKKEDAVKGPCEDEALKKIVDIIGADDKANVLGALYEMTSLRLAIRAKQEKNNTLEDLAKKHLAELGSNVAAIEGSEEKKAQILKVYNDYGKQADLGILSSELHANDKFVNGKVVPCYWGCKETRLLNEHSSAYVLAMSHFDSAPVDNYKVTELDAATIWAVEKIRNTAASTDKSYNVGTSKGNLMQINTRVVRYLGAIAGGEDLSEAEMKNRIDMDTAKVQSAIYAAFDTVKQSLIDCLNQANNNCEECTKKSLMAFESDKITKTFKALLSKVNTMASDGLTINQLKGKANNVYFDLSNYGKGNVPAWYCPGKTAKNPCTGKVVNCSEYNQKHFGVKDIKVEDPYVPVSSIYKPAQDNTYVQKPLVNDDAGLKVNDPKAASDLLNGKQPKIQTLKPGQTIQYTAPKEGYQLNEQQKQVLKDWKANQVKGPSLPAEMKDNIQKLNQETQKKQGSISQGN